MALVFLSGLLILTLWIIRSRNLHCWLTGYLVDKVARRKSKPNTTVDLLVCVADHFEPLWDNVDDQIGQRRMDTWMHRFPELAKKHSDSDGKAPVHTFFYPGEQYRSIWLDSLAELCQEGMAEVEIHLHHGHDTVEGVNQKLSTFRDQLADHRLLSSDNGSGKIRYAFIHGDWALANSGKGPESCGVDEELRVLVDTGCYADFTFPSAPSSTQIPTVNRMFFVNPDQRGIKPHGRGVQARIGEFRDEDLLLIEGPLTFNWSHRKFGILPRIENSDLSGSNPSHPDRIPLWLNTQIHVEGRPEWQFIKLHTHGAPERNHEALLGEAMDSFLSHLEQNYNDGKTYRLHYVSAREMYNIARAAMDGKSGDAGEFRNHRLTPRWSSR